MKRKINHSKDIAELKKEIEQLKTEIEQLKKNESKLKKKIDRYSLYGRGCDCESRQRWNAIFTPLFPPVW